MISMIKVVTERVPYLYTCCDTLLTAEDIASSMRFQHERRRMEHLTWRRIVRHELGRGVAISYNDVGAPIVDLPNTYISVAHGGGMAVVAISDSPIGVDIESLERDFTRAADRYMSAQELALSTRHQWAAMVWTAKEALYKLYGRRGLDLLNDLTVFDYDQEEQTLQGRVKGGDEATISFNFIDDKIIIATAQLR